MCFKGLFYGIITTSSDFLCDFLFCVASVIMVNNGVNGFLLPALCDPQTQLNIILA